MPTHSLRRIGKNCVEAAAESNAIFLGSLERWIEATVECNMEANGSIGEMVRKVRENYARSMQSNIEYHKILAHIYEQTDDSKSPFYMRHQLMAQIYTSLLPR